MSTPIKRGAEAAYRLDMPSGGYNDAEEEQSYLEIARAVLVAAIDPKGLDRVIDAWLAKGLARDRTELRKDIIAHLTDGAGS